MRLHSDADCSSICRVSWAGRRKKRSIGAIRARTGYFSQECAPGSGRRSPILQLPAPTAPRVRAVCQRLQSGPMTVASASGRGMPFTRWIMPLSSR